MKNTARQLTRVYESLNKQAQSSLLDYAEYLLSKSGSAAERITEPVEIVRPSVETVVGAIKRLKATYPMIESGKVFSAASSLMTEHMINGRDVVEVIDDMQVLFEDAFAAFSKEDEDD